MNNNLPKNIFSSNSFWGHLVGLPLFVLGFFLLFCPFAFKNYEITFAQYSFHITMTASIILLVMLVSRLVLMSINKKSPIKPRLYFFACFFEIVFSSGFVSTKPY